MNEYEETGDLREMLEADVACKLALHELKSDQLLDLTCVRP